MTRLATAANSMRSLFLLVCMATVMVAIAFSPNNVEFASRKHSRVGTRISIFASPPNSQTNYMTTRSRPFQDGYELVHKAVNTVSWAATQHICSRRGPPASYCNNRSCLWATSAATSNNGASPSNNKDEKNNGALKKIWTSFLAVLNKYIASPIRALIKLVAKLFKRKANEKDTTGNHESLAKNVQKLYESVHEEPIAVAEESMETNGKVLTTSSPPPSVAASTASSSAAEIETETRVTTSTATLERPKETTEQLIDTTDPAAKWAVAASGVNLSGNWSMIISEPFKKEYDDYLKKLGQPLLVRSVALSIVGMTTEETIQKNDGRELLIRGRNARGVWDRTLVTSLRESEKVFSDPHVEDIITADDEIVKAEAWWEKKGTVHKSWLRGGTKYGGGDFESARFIEDDPEHGQVLVCRSTFHPNDKTREQACVTWKFKRH